MPTVQERRAAYREAQTRALKQHQSNLEEMRSVVGMGVLAEFPDAELTWETVGNHPQRVLSVYIRLRDYAVAGFITHRDLDNPERVLAILIGKINAELSKIRLV